MEGWAKKLVDRRQWLYLLVLQFLPTSTYVLQATGFLPLLWDVFLKLLLQFSLCDLLNKKKCLYSFYVALHQGKLTSRKDVLHLSKFLLKTSFDWVKKDLMINYNCKSALIGFTYYLNNSSMCVYVLPVFLDIF